MWSPVENLRRFFISNPPWVLFLASLAAMAIGVTILAYHINGDRRFDTENDNNVASFCWLNKKFNKLNKPKPAALMFSENNISISVRLAVHQGFVDFINSARFPIVRGTVYNGQLGLKNKFVNDSWSFDMLPVVNSSYCRNKNACTLQFMQACLIVRAEDRSQLPSGWEGYSCTNITTDDVFTKQNEMIETVLINERNSDTISSLQNRKDTGTLCREELDVTIENIDISDFVLLPMVHDSIVARLHLLYTSYFLMVTVLLVLCYAICRRSSAHHRPRHHQDKEAADEPQLSRYARLRD